MKKILVVVMAMVAMFWFASPKTASSDPLALESRDGGKMYYDPNLKITWLTEPNNTGSTWDGAKSYAAGLNVDGITGWRLPTTLGTISAFTDEGEMGYLYHDELGNPLGGSLSNKGPFTDLQAFVYWTGKEYTPLPAAAWYYYFGNGYQSYNDKRDDLIYSWAVHDGDVGGVTVPEPSLMVLLVISMASIVGLRRWWKD